MKSLSDQKKAHALRMNVTTDDEKYYKEPLPLTDEQKEILLAQEEETKRMTALEIQSRKNWMEKRYEDKTDKEEKLW